jgi:hypothetical protein
MHEYCMFCAVVPNYCCTTTCMSEPSLVSDARTPSPEDTSGLGKGLSMDGSRPFQQPNDDFRRSRTVGLLRSARGDSNAGGDGPGTEQGRSRDGAGSVPQRVTSPIRSAKGDRPIHENAMVAIPEGRSLPIFHGSKTGTRRQSSDQESHVKASQSYGCRTVSR